jgi:hypothetical protein
MPKVAVKVPPVKEVGFGPIKGADHKEQAYHYQLTPGLAFTDQADGWRKTVQVTEEMAKKIPYTYKLGWISGKTVAIFEKDGVEYAQPLEGSTGHTGRMKGAPKEESIVQQVKKIKEAEKAGVVIERTKKGRVAKAEFKPLPPDVKVVKPAKAAKPDKPKRQKTMTLL